MSQAFQKLFEEDQYHVKRWSKHYSDEEFYFINARLRTQVKKLIDAGKAKDGFDYFASAIIYHHAFKITHSRTAIRYAKKAVKLGYPDNWIIAACTDRLLQLQGKPQKYGTQYVENKSGKFRIYRVDPKTTDEERAEFGLPTLRELKKSYR